MNYDSINTISLSGICMCCGSSIYGITVTRSSVVKPQSAINCLWYDTFAGLNARAFTEEQKVWIFGVHTMCFIGGLSVYWWGLRRSILVGTWLRLINRTVYVIN